MLKICPKKIPGENSAKLNVLHTKEVQTLQDQIQTLKQDYEGQMQVAVEEEKLRNSAAIDALETQVKTAGRHFVARVFYKM